MTSSGSSVKDTLTAYLAGRATAERVVAVVAAEYYGSRGMGNGEWLQPVIDVIERAHPGVVELAAASDRPGFSVRLAERPFPKRLEDQLRAAVNGTMHTVPQSPVPHPGLFTRIIRAIRRVFSA